ncbi:MAG: 50S ribosomal protein L35 [Patescibacteria group bacterium]|jgi:large subunit ribosomal protein L35
MPKLKTHKATVKRVRKTGSGILMRDKAAVSHLLTHKSDRKKVPQRVTTADIKKVKKLAPYL